jgi:hypothetical protein
MSQQTVLNLPVALSRAPQITLELELALELDPQRQNRSQKTEDRIQN